MAAAAAGLAAGTLLVAALWIGPVGQDPGYHRFADQRPLLGLGHGADVLSSLPLSLAGLAGVLTLLRAAAHDRPGIRRARLPWLLFFLGTSLTGLGSGWYHLQPDTQRLFWDRLPMALAFASLAAAVIEEGCDGIREGAVSASLIPLGIAGVLWWGWTEQRGSGDLRWYVLTQLLPMIAVPILLTARRAAYAERGLLWAALGTYLAAKAAEAGDFAVFSATAGEISGHTLKHLLAAAGAWLLCLRARRIRPATR